MAAYRLQELIHFQASSFRGLVHGGQRIEGHLPGAEDPEAVHHPVEGGLPAFVFPVFVVEVLGSVQGESHQEVVVPEKIGPGGIQQRSVGLEGVEDRFPVGVFPLEFHGFPVEIQAHYQWLSAVPVELDFRDVVGCDIVPYHFLQHIHGHAGLPAAIKIGLFQIIAVMAVQVTERTGRFEHNVESRRTADPDRIFQQKHILERVCHIHQNG